MEKQVKKTNVWNRLTSGILVLVAIFGISWISPSQTMAERTEEIKSYVNQLNEEVVDTQKRLFEDTKEQPQEKIKHSQIANNVLKEEKIVSDTTVKKDSASKVVMEKLRKELEDIKELMESEEFEKLKSIDNIMGVEEMMEQMMEANEMKMQEIEEALEAEEIAKIIEVEALKEIESIDFSELALELDNLGDFNFRLNGKDIRLEDLEGIGFEDNTIILTDKNGKSYFNLSSDNHDFSFHIDGDTYEFEFDNNKSKKYNEKVKKQHEENLKEQLEEKRIVISGELEEELEDMLVDDRLIKKGQDYTLKFNSRGMKINGKKISNQKLLKKYKKMVGNREIEIIKKKGKNTVIIED